MERRLSFIIYGLSKSSFFNFHAFIRYLAPRTSRLVFILMSFDVED